MLEKGPLLEMPHNAAGAKDEKLGTNLNLGREMAVHLAKVTTASLYHKLHDKKTKINADQTLLDKLLFPYKKTISILCF